MGNSESRSPNDQIPPHAEEVMIKLAECASTLPMMKEFGTKGLSEAFKAGAFHAEDNYIKGGACKESFMSLAECPDRDKPDKQAALLDCMEAHSDYYHKYLEIVDEHIVKVGVKEFESTFPGGEEELVLGIHRYFMKGKGRFCKKQYKAFLDCAIEESCKEEQCGPFMTAITKMIFRFL